jgi:hypothetical protein
MKISVVLYQNKLLNLHRQLKSIQNQSIDIHEIVVFQNKSRVDITDLQQEYGFTHIQSTVNTQYFGRYSHCLTLDTDIIVMIDDDVILGKECINNYMKQCIKLNAVIGQSGGFMKYKLPAITEPCIYGHQLITGIRKVPVLVDYVDRVLCFKQEWVKYMFDTPPYTYKIGDNMHLCLSCKLKEGIKSYCARQVELYEHGDVTMGRIELETNSDRKYITDELRETIAKHFRNKYNMWFVK